MAEQSVETCAEQSDEASEDGESQQVDMDTDMVSEAEMGEEGREGMTPWRPNTPIADLPPDFDYTAYITKYDEIVGAE